MTVIYQALLVSYHCHTSGTVSPKALLNVVIDLLAVAIGLLFLVRLAAAAPEQHSPFGKFEDYSQQLPLQTSVHCHVEPVPVGHNRAAAVFSLKMFQPWNIFPFHTEAVVQVGKQEDLFSCCFLWMPEFLTSAGS